jgi:hypothetical protein
MVFLQAFDYIGLDEFFSLLKGILNVHKFYYLCLTYLKKPVAIPPL